MKKQKIFVVGDIRGRFQAFKEVLKMTKDPLKYCELYKDKTCCHADMPGCDVDTCLLLKQYLKSKNDKLFWAWFDKNIIYCEDTHSFVHRLCKKLNIKDYKKAQHLAFDVIKEMKEDYNKNKKKNDK